MEDRNDFIESLIFFAFVATTAMCLSFTFSVIVYSMGLPHDPTEFVTANLFISACVAIPTATLAAQHEFRMRLYQRRLESMASTDSLTGLLNRKFFTQFATEEQMRMKRTDYMAAIAVFDVDHFKRVNDDHGHAIGDQVLKEIAALAYSELRGPFDRLGRWGGEEFVMLLSSVTLQQAIHVTERVRQRISNHEIETNAGVISVTASFGVALLDSDGSIESIIEKADLAMYDSKAKGRNRVTVSCGTSPSEAKAPVAA